MCTTVAYVPGKYMFIADTLSRAATEKYEDTDMVDKTEVHVNELVKYSNVSSDKLSLIRAESKKDKSLQSVTKYCLDGWPHTKNLVDSEAKPYWCVKDELYVVNGVIFRNGTIVIPMSIKNQILKKIHEGHLGIEKCKRRAREVVYWPSMSRDIQSLVEGCETCQRRRDANKREPLAPHPVPRRPWQVLATDIFELLGKYYLLVVDYYSKYIEIEQLNNLQSSSVIMHLKKMFSRFGIPEKLISDNAGTYVSEEFKRFVESWEFEHVTSSPLYPRSNGLAERNVRTAKNLLLKAHESGEDPHIALLNFRNTPISGEQWSPAQLLMGRRLMDKLPNDEEKLACTINNKEMERSRMRRIASMRKKYDRGTRPLPPLSADEPVRVRGRDGCWARARIEGAAPQPRSYWVRTDDGARYRRNRQHLIKAKPYKFNYDDLKVANQASSPMQSSSPIQSSSPMQSSTPAAITDATDMDRDYKISRYGRRIVLPNRYGYTT